MKHRAENQRSQHARARRRLRRLSAASLVGGLAVLAACDGTPVQPEADATPQFAWGGGRGGGPGGGGGQSSLTVSFGAGTVSDDGGGAYVDGQGGVQAVLGSGGNLSFLVGEGAARQLFIGAIEDSGGTELVAETGLHGAHITTPGCCDLRTMSSGDTVKVKIRWNVPDGFYAVSMGSTTNCGSGGQWADVSQTIAADTTWTIQSAGPSGLCRVIDLPGKKNDQEIWYPDAVVDLDLTFSTN